MAYVHYYLSPLGTLRLTSDGKALTGIWYDKDLNDSQLLKSYKETPLPAIFQETTAWLDAYFAGNVPDFTPALKMQTTPFRQRVWEIMCTIPYGETVTYGDIAKQLAKERHLDKMSAQAVGGAVGHNAISIIIPCHRVVGANGSLTGYAGGIDKKIRGC